MGQYVIASYRPKPGRDEELLDLVRDHLPILRREGLATETEPVVLKGADGAMVEIFEWVSAEAVEAAHSNPTVLELWGRFGEVCDFVPMSDLEEGRVLFPAFERVDLGRANDR